MPGRAIVIMGVSGCGKTTVGQELARALGWEFLEGDTLHPPRNVQLMAAGTPLTDDDRREWLDAVAQRLAAARQPGLVVSCSALKRSYRERLRKAAPGLLLVHLHGDPGVLARRMASRQGHYMPASLLQSQLDTLELPAPDEQALTFDIGESPARIVDAVRQHVGTPA